MIFVLYFYALTFMMGASIASFLSVVVERVPQGKSIGGRSHCVCGRQLKATENIPIFGWLKSFGKAKCCGSRIPAWYFWAEVGGGAAAIAVVATAAALFNIQMLTF